MTIELNKTTVVFGVILLVLGYFVGNVLPIVGGGYTLPQGATTGGTQQTAPSAPVKLTIPSYALFEGQSSAKVNVVEFGDYQCPFCERFFSQVEPSISTNYVDKGKAKFYFMDFAFLGPDSTTLSEGAWCANEQGKYYAYHDYIYSHQQQENTGWATADKVKAMVGNITGLDAAKFATCLDSGKYASRVKELTQLGQTSGVSGTPSTLIGTPDKGYTLLVGAQPYAVFQQAIDSYLQ